MGTYLILAGIGALLLSVGRKHKYHEQPPMSNGERRALWATKYYLLDSCNHTANMFETRFAEEQRSKTICEK